MKKQIKYSNAPKKMSEIIINAETINDFLPAPDKLIFKEINDKITLSLTRSSIKFFKEKSAELGIPYQSMIKRVVDIYARKYQVTTR